MSPSLYLTVVPLILRNGQPMFNRRSFCSTFTLHPRMAAYTCSSTHAQGTAGTCVRSTTRGRLLISQKRLKPTLQHQSEWEAMPNLDIDDAVPQPTQLIEKAYKFLFQRQVGVTIIGLPLRFGI